MQPPLSALPLVLLLAAALPACASPDQSSLVVDVTSEASPGVSLDHIHINVSENGANRFDSDYSLTGSGSIGLPGTLTVRKADSTALDTPVTVTVQGFDAAGKTRVIRSATLTFVSGKNKLLRIPLQFACFDRTCDAGQTCKQGLCTADTIDPVVLPEYADTQVATTRERGSCFDRDACMQGGDQAAPGSSSTDPNLVGIDVADLVASHMLDLAHPGTPTSPLQFDRDSAMKEVPTKCTLPNPAVGHDKNLNMGAFWTYEKQHWVVVDFDPDEGWTFAKDRARVQLAPGLCAELHTPTPRIAKLITYGGQTSCPPKPPTQPECADTGVGMGGPAGSGGATGSGGSGGAPAGQDAGAPDTGLPSDAGTSSGGAGPGADASADAGAG